MSRSPHAAAAARAAMVLPHPGGPKSIHPVRKRKGAPAKRAACFDGSSSASRSASFASARPPSELHPSWSAPPVAAAAAMSDPPVRPRIEAGTKPSLAFSKSSAAISANVLVVVEAAPFERSSRRALAAWIARSSKRCASPRSYPSEAAAAAAAAPTAHLIPRRFASASSSSASPLPPGAGSASHKSSRPALRTAAATASGALAVATTATGAETRAIPSKRSATYSASASAEDTDGPSSAPPDPAGTSKCKSSSNSTDGARATAADAASISFSRALRTSNAARAAPLSATTAARTAASWRTSDARPSIRAVRPLLADPCRRMPPRGILVTLSRPPLPLLTFVGSSCSFGGTEEEGDGARAALSRARAWVATSEALEEDERTPAAMASR
mmetsp:Transcript_8161/g.27104  ORF Transcript_8161/g.27104 Transcript_8161/m.27104 type:complete len:388 (-) Transcript_8161:2064-3227(-)